MKDSLKKPVITENENLRPVTNEEMEKIFAGWGFGACAGVCFFFGAA